MPHLDTDKAFREKASQQLYKNAVSCNEQILDVTSHKAAPIWPPLSHLKLFKPDEQDMLDK